MKTMTIRQYQAAVLISKTYADDEVTLTKELLKVFGKDLTIIKKESDELLTEVANILSQTPDFIQRFTFKGVEYGFIPNLDDITVGEYIDLDSYFKDDTDFIRLASILYRPIKKKVGKMYTIEEYNGTNDTLADADHKIITGAMVFFWNLSNSLSQDINTYLLSKKK